MGREIARLMSTIPSRRFGRLIDHVHIRTRKFSETQAFYEAILGALGRRITSKGEGYFCSDELYVDRSEDYESRIHLAFQAEDRAAVERFHTAGLASGGRDNGPPGERSYHSGYYACFLLDPNGNNIEAVYHGPGTRSASDVITTRL